MEHICGSNPLMESALRKTLRANVKATMDARQMVQADLHAAVSKGSAHRVTAGQNVTLDVLQGVAKALKVPAWALLHPDFDAKNPLVIQTAAQIEAEVERRVKERIKPLSAIIGGLIDPEESRPDGRSAALPYPVGPATAGKPAHQDTPKGETAGKGRRR